MAAADTSHSDARIAAALAAARTPDGVSLDALSRRSPVLILFLRHFGCVFCREMVAQVARDRDAIAARGTQVAFVHMGTEDQARVFFDQFGVGHLPRVSDRGRQIYAAFALGTVGARQAVSPYLWRRWVALFRDRRMRGRFIGDVRQMSGAFLIDRGAIVKAFRHDSMAEAVDLDEMTTCPLPARQDGGGGHRKTNAPSGRHDVGGDRGRAVTTTGRSAADRSRV